jgi:cytosine deaminase
VAHISSLAVQPDDVAAGTIAAIAETGVQVVVNPIIVKITRLQELLAAGVSVSFGADNIRDPFYPLGDANPLSSAMLACQIAALGSQEDLARVFDAVMTGAARMAGVPGQAGIQAGAPADLAVFPSPTPIDVLLDQRAPLAVIRRGQIVSRTAA